MDFSWADPYPEVHKICCLFQLCEVSNPVKFKYKPLKEFLQEGPQCGLVSLAICLGKCEKQFVEEMFTIAKEKNWTYHGEMFSVCNMADLIKLYIPESASVQLYEGDLNTDGIKQFLLEGGMILVPYDTDKDNSPGLHKGHKAHWAVICGAIKTNEDFYVIARHGKARNVAIWKLSLLTESNKQLLEFSPDRKLQHVDYKLPEGGICGPKGLNHKSLLIIGL